MQPVDHFEIFVQIDALQGRYPRLENLEPAHRTVMTSLSWGIETRGPGRADAADENETGVVRLRHLDGLFAFTNFALSNHLRLASKSRRHYASHHLPASITASPQIKPAKIERRVRKKAAHPAASVV